MTMLPEEKRINMRMDLDFYEDAKLMQKARKYRNLSEYMRALIRQDRVNFEEQERQKKIHENK